LALTSDQNAAVARAWHDEPAARGALVERWRRERAPWDVRCCGNDDGASFFCDVALYPWLAPLLDKYPEGRQRAAAALALPPRELLAILGDARLGRTVQQRVLDQSFALRCPIHPYRMTGSLLPRYSTAIRLLSDAELDTAGWCVHLLERCVLHDEVAADVGAAFAQRHRPLAVSWAATRATHSEAVPAIQAIVAVVAVDPMPRECHDLATIATTVNAGLIVYHALDALEQLDWPGDRDWVARLNAWAAEADTLVAIRAAAALARRTANHGLDVLVRGALQAPTVVLRAEAIRRLGDLDARGDFEGLFIEALLQDHETLDEAFAPAAEEAAFALARVGSDTALEALVCGHVDGPTHSVCDATTGYVKRLLACREGRPAPMVLDDYNWRRRVLQPFAARWG
jgi:hypothetical protein